MFDTGPAFSPVSGTDASPSLHDFLAHPSSTVGGGATVWNVGALCRAVSDSLQARFNPVQVRGEVSGFSRAASGHCYFTLKDETGQLRCAMFRRAAQHLDFTPTDGDLVQVRAQLSVYGQRGELQLVVEYLQRAGQGAWFEQFLRLKARLQAQGLFDPQRKRPITAMPRGIGLVTSLGAAALRDVATALQRRAPHVPVVLVNALVQGPQAAPSLVQALRQLYALIERPAPVTSAPGTAGRPAELPPIDTILLVRGGGAMEDLWAFNDETLAHTIVASPVPVICGVGHETDFTIADFCADLRAPTPTAAAELAVRPRADSLAELAALTARQRQAMRHRLDVAAQRTDRAALHLRQPAQMLHHHRLLLQNLTQRLHAARQRQWQLHAQSQHQLTERISQAHNNYQTRQHQRLRDATLRLQLLNPEHLMRRGWTVLTTLQGQTVTGIAQAPVGAALRAHLADGVLDLSVTHPRLL